MSREIASIDEIVDNIEVRRDKYTSEKVKGLYANLALPSYVHGYSLAIEYMYNWFESKFEKDYFKGGIYVDGKHVLDDYKKFSKSVIKAENPRARMVPTIDYDFDREKVDFYLGPPELYLRRSKFEDSFFKDFERDMFLGLNMKALKMNFNFKVRVNTRAQQLDIYNRMNMYFGSGTTRQDNISVDFHIPKSIILNIAKRAGFEVIDGKIKNIIEFLNYMNSHSDLPFLFKIRAINQKPEFFIRVRNLYVHVDCRENLQVDDGERDGKLDCNFHVETTVVLTLPVPQFYSFYSADDLKESIELKEGSDSVAIYSINVFEIPKLDENGWAQAAITEWATDNGDTEMDLSSIFSGDNILSQAINHDMTRNISPSHFINIKVYRDNDTAKLCEIEMDWETKIAYFKNGPEPEEILHIAMYYDREYINNLDIELNNYNNTRLN